VEIPKPTDQDKTVFRALVPDRPDLVIKPMFGNLGAYVNGNMFMGLFGSSVGLKLSDADRQSLLAVEGTGPFGPPERPMAAYVSLPEAWAKAVEAIGSVGRRSLSFVAALVRRPKSTRRALGATSSPQEEASFDPGQEQGKEPVGGLAQEPLELPWDMS